MKAENLEKAAAKIVTDAAIHANDLQDACNQILCGLIDLLHFDGGAVYTKPGNEKRMETIQVIGADPDQKAKFFKTVSTDNLDRFCATVAKKQKAAYCSNTSRASKLQDREMVRGLNIRSIITWPVFSPGKNGTLAVLQLWSKKIRRIEKSDRAVLKTITSTLAALFGRLISHFELSKREERYRFAINASMDAIMVLQKGGRIFYANPAAHRMFGFPRNELIGQALDVVLPGSLREVHQNHIEQFFKTGTARIAIGVPQEVRAFRRDGTRFPMEITLSDGHSGAEPFLLATLRDLTETKGFEDRLFAERQRLVSLLEMLPASISFVNADYTIRYANRHYRTNFGDPEQKHCYELMYGRNKPCRRCKPFEASQKMRSVNFTVHRKDRRCFRFYTYPFTDIDGSNLVLEMGIEITDLVQAEDALRKSEVHARTQFKNIPLPTYTWKKVGPDFQLVDFNNAAFRVTEGRIADFLGAKLSIFYCNDPEIQKDVHRCFKTKSEFSRQMPYTFRTTGKKRILMVHFGYVPTDRVIIHTDDITDRIEAEKEVHKALAKAREADMFKTRFLANMSHEIRTPLNAISGLTTIMLMKKNLSEQKKQDYLEVIKKSGESLLVMIDQVLDIAKIESGKVEAKTVAFDLYELLYGLIRRYAQQAEARQLALRFFMDNPVPVMVVGEPVMLEVVLNNLVGNAIKFTRKGHVGIYVDRGDDKGKKATLTFRIEDTGIGIWEEQRELIFKSFYQVDGSSNREYGGAGLGLAISRELVTAMDGEIDFESTPGKGSVFTFTCRVLPQTTEKES